MPAGAGAAHAFMAHQACVPGTPGEGPKRFQNWFKNEVKSMVKKMRFFGTPAWLGAGWLAGVLTELLDRMVAL